MRKLAIFCRKGGVGKTTTTVNLGFELNKKGKKVLIIDLDGQSDVSKFFGRTEVEFWVGDVLTNRKFDIKNAIYPAIIKSEEINGLDIIAGRAGDAMVEVDAKLMASAKGAQHLAMQLNKIADEYDYVLIDCAPTTSRVTANGITCADEYLIPAELKGLALDGLELAIEHIEDVCYVDEDDLDFLIVPTKAKKASTRLNRQALDFLHGRFPDNVSDTVIWERGAFVDAEYVYQPVSVAKPSDVAVRLYRELAQELIDNEQ